MTQIDTDNSQSCYRTSRMYLDQGHWFFRTREGDIVGPFDEELAASTQLEVYIRLVQSGLLPFQEVLRPVALPKSLAG